MIAKQQYTQIMAILQKKRSHSLTISKIYDSHVIIHIRDFNKPKKIIKNLEQVWLQQLSKTRSKTQSAKLQFLKIKQGITLILKCHINNIILFKQIVFTIYYLYFKVNKNTHKFLMAPKKNVQYTINNFKDWNGQKEWLKNCLPHKRSQLFSEKILEQFLDTYIQKNCIQSFNLNKLPFLIVRKNRNKQQSQTTAIQRKRYFQFKIFSIQNFALYTRIPQSRIYQSQIFKNILYLQHCTGSKKQQIFNINFPIIKKNPTSTKLLNKYLKHQNFDLQIN
eukprot:TRINITY_DN8823_c0_g1_i1.p2 TRINITY_DN8823_c0_g1~~TRINITY_DN8823_c0_g1_i1.p2  ORF type:complete len:278 (-),score=-29.01 TRINITY_DN8823_c0_g1_i1:631-1464(-)